LGEGRSALTLDHPWTQGWGEARLVVAPAPDPAPTEFLTDRKAIKYMGPCTQMAVLAAGRALRDAGLLNAMDEAERAACALYVATGPIAFDVEHGLQTIGGAGAADLLALKQQGLRRCHPLLPFKMLLNMPLGLVSITFGIKGPNAAFYPGAEQGAVALEHALRGLRQGRFSRVLVGASAHGLSLAPLIDLYRQGRLAASVEAAAPFGDQHAGWAAADQAAFLVLENAAEAQRRGQRAYAVVDGVELAGPNSVDRVWAGLTAPDVVWTTGASSRADVQADVDRARSRWGSAVLASADGLLGVAPATSWVLACALACVALRQGRVPAPLLNTSGDHVRRILVSFHDQQAAVAAVLSGGA
jgi:hypothetical protein